MSAPACTDCPTPARSLRNALIVVRVFISLAAEWCVLSTAPPVRSIGKLKVSMHGPMNFANSVLSKEGQDTQEQLSTKRAAKPKAAGGAPGTAADKGKTLKEGDASVPAPPLPPSSPATAAVAAVAVAAAPVAPKSSV